MQCLHTTETIVLNLSPARRTVKKKLQALKRSNLSDSINSLGGNFTGCFMEPLWANVLYAISANATPKGFHIRTQGIICGSGGRHC